MTADVDADFHLHERARLALGDDAASTLMNHLPRDVDQLATKQDLVNLKKNLTAEIERTARVVVVSLIVALGAMLGGAAGLAQVFG